ncbi:MAG: FAD-binding oxidoreductase [Flavobacteriales bacterium]|jgi:gamma-glutamylputrescine oxidase|nr:FAD-binding oxidoreductase [Flavobacteriales bacterium]HOZ40326.1 FAD-dependent oxidoreductase [Flavobacteriales bacterium]
MHSIWQHTGFHAAPHLTVIGGGLVGLFTALHYKRTFPTQRVLVLERGPFPSGASVKNAGFACFGSPSELLADLDREGEMAMLARVHERYQGLLELRAELGDATIGFEPTGGHELYRHHDPLYTRVAERFDRLNELLRPLFGRTVFHWDPQHLSASGMQGVAHLASTPLEGGLDSGKLMSALLAKAVGIGILFRPSAEVVGFEEGSQAVLIRLASGEEIHSGQVVVATNAWTQQLLPHLDVRPARGQVILTAPVPDLRIKGTFHYKEGYYYFRDLAGGILLGGGRELDIDGETTAEEGTTPLIQDALETLLREVILPGTNFRITRRWSGIMGLGPTKVPVVERVSERVIAAVRLGGMGVAIGIRVAHRAARLVEGA